MGILRPNELQQLEMFLAQLRSPVPEQDQAAKEAELERLGLYLLELSRDRGFVL